MDNALPDEKEEAEFIMQIIKDNNNLWASPEES
jgi:hypothetical protein